MALMEQIADKVLPQGTGYEWTAMSYQEKLVGNQIYWIFALAMLLVYLVLWRKLTRMSGASVGQPD